MKDVSMSLDVDYLQSFDVSPSSFPWREERVQEINLRRAHMNDCLIFDILLSSSGIYPPDAFYPPATPEALQTLLNAIANCSFDALKRDCLVYCLLKWYQDGREEDFKIKRCIPPQFSSLADAYWHLDSGITMARAVSILSDARINRDYTSKVFEALSLSQDPHNLIRSYVRTAKPVLDLPSDMDAYTIALAESSLMEAWTYQRTFPEIDENRERLINKILDWCLTPKPRLTSLTHLLAFPFSPYEQTRVHAYALDPPEHIPAASIPVIQDLVCVRLVQSGQHAEAIKLDRQFPSATRGGDKAQKAAHDRRQMLEELKAAMPTAERLLLDLELEEFSQGRGLDASVAKGKGMAIGMSMSWQEVRPPSSSAIVKYSGVQAISHRSGAPRFGGPAPATASTTVPAEEEMFPSISHGPSISAAPQMPKPPSQAGILFGGISAQPSQPSTSSTSWIPKSTSGTGNGQSLFGSSGTGAFGGARPSLFDTAGSANAAPNAFYTPPASLSAKRTPIFGSMAAKPASVSAFADLNTLSASTSSAKGARKGRKSAGGAGDVSGAGAELDISMLSELSESDGDGDNGDSSFAVERGLVGDGSMDMDTSAEFSVSVFGRPAEGEGQRRIATGRGSRIARTETEARLPPGAFLPDEEPARAPPAPEKESASAAKSAKKARAKADADAASAAALPETQPEPEPEAEPEPRRTSARTRARTSGRAALKRSVPGGFMDTDEEEEEEEEDAVPPLPVTPARPVRKTRSKGGAPAAPAASATPARRSSRLSAVGSVGSSSPEPLSPVKLAAGRTRKTRASTGAASASASTAAPRAAGTKTRKRKS
ncbi:nuclear pore complex assembly-domain-containing protein [Epithele typhae]|uniref:nuclear pore complex assembly-domain-containing protein n=1 Tax=Epithele typhae TaxID=378194 RepID=UPI00200759B5|nr:nuclear pore complex assembly-domain-containing protein [Epithele typhae]KAH9941763.1 nuclear pore complex assembly-domain-containing protein [Epithele typhae]